MRSLSNACYKASRFCCFLECWRNYLYETGRPHFAGAASAYLTCPGLARQGSFCSARDGFRVTRYVRNQEDDLAWPPGERAHAGYRGRVVAGLQLRRFKTKPDLGQLRDSLAPRPKPLRPCVLACFWTGPDMRAPCRISCLLKACTGTST